LEVFAMFIATMYSYGSDPECVGVDGIVGCMGVFLAYNGMLYAIHIPDTPARFTSGRTKFVAYVNQQAPAFDGKQAHLYGVLNGVNRSGAYLELLEYAAALSVKRITTIRLNENLGTKGAMQDSAAVLCEFIPHTGNCRLKYQKAASVKWTRDTETVRAGYYDVGSYDLVLGTSAALSNGWILVDAQNSTIVEKY
jgi:hypothetical protein